MSSNNGLKFFFYMIAASFIAITLFYPRTIVKAYKEITPSEVKEISSNPSSGALIIDVRTPEEFKQGHIASAINIPLQILSDSLGSKNIKKDTKIVLYCQSGVRSKKAAEILDKLGYANVHTMGGINSWTYELVKE